MAQITKTPLFLKKEQELKQWQEKIKKLNSQLKRNKTSLNKLQTNIEHDHRVFATQYIPTMLKIADLHKQVMPLIDEVKRLKKFKGKERKIFFEALDAMQLDEMSDAFEESADMTELIKEKMEKQPEPEEQQEQGRGFSSVFEQFVQKTDENEQKEIRKIFTKLANRFHPDKARSHEEGEFFHVMMQRLNDAYQRGDTAELLRIQKQYENYEAPDPEKWDDNATLDYLQTQIEKAKKEHTMLETQLNRVKTELNQLNKTDLANFVKQNKRNTQYTGETMEDSVQSLQAIEKAFIYLKDEAIPHILNTNKMPTDFMDKLGELLGFSADDEEDEDEISDDMIAQMLFGKQRKEEVTLDELLGKLIDMASQEQPRGRRRGRR